MAERGASTTGKNVPPRSITQKVRIESRTVKEVLDAQIVF